jgi:two-component system, NarL family, invasion response regulator UvrY
LRKGVRVFDKGTIRKLTHPLPQMGRALARVIAMKVLIADDHAVFREGLKRILNEAADVSEVGEAANAQQLMKSISDIRWDVILLDINMPGKSGLEVLKEIKQTNPRLAVLILSMYPEKQFAVRVIKAGAAGYITKAAAGSEVLQAIRKVYRDGKYISDSVAEHLAMAVELPVDRPLHESLSDREFEVLRMIGSGKTVSEIAEELSLSVKTISTYRTHILEKMNLKNNADIMQYVITHGLAD